jgi:copper chaperone CopZ
MQIKHTGTMLLVVTAVSLLALLAFYVRIGATADSVAVLRTTGMTCGSCSDKISAALEREKGVAATEVDVAGGWVVVGYDTKTVTPELLEKKVRETGYASSVYAVLTPEQFKQATGREIGRSASSSGGCGGCGSNGGGCGGANQIQAKGE